MHLPLRLPTRQLMVCFALLLMLLGGRTARAQSIHWSSGYPSLDNDRIVTLESERTLRIRIAALGSDVNNATIVVTLPSGIDYVTGSATPVSPGITLSENLAGSVLTLTIGGDGKLPLNQEKEFHLKVKATTCVPPAAVSFGVEVQSGGTPVTDGTKTVQANIVRPILTLTPQNAVVNFTSQTQTQTISYYLKATTVDKASSARVSFTTPDAATTLTNFKVKGAAVTPTETPAAGGGKTYTFDVTSATLGAGNQIDQTNRHRDHLHRRLNGRRRTHRLHCRAVPLWHHGLHVQSGQPGAARLPRPHPAAHRARNHELRHTAPRRRAHRP